MEKTMNKSDVVKFIADSYCLSISTDELKKAINIIKADLSIGEKSTSQKEKRER